MGSTIRRTPVNYNIPAKPKYQFNNIVDFGGLQITDNPLIAKQNTASDMLNVYVDETNALTTRPRLEKEFDYESAIRTVLSLSPSDVVSVLRICPIKGGFLVYYKTTISSTTAYRWLIKRDDTIYTISSTSSIEAKDFTYFEDNDDVYVLSGSGYFKIQKNESAQSITYVLSGASPYVPTTKIGVKKYDSNNNIYYENGVAYEPLNLLTNKYYERNFWDGESFPDCLKDVSREQWSVKNDYYGCYVAENEDLLGSNKHGIFLTKNHGLNSTQKQYYVIDETTQNITVKNFGPIARTDELVCLANDKKRIVRYAPTYLETNNPLIEVYDFDENTNSFETTGYFRWSVQDSSNKFPKDATRMSLSDDGKYLVFLDGSADAGVFEIYMDGSNDSITKKYEITAFLSGYTIRTVSFYKQNTSDFFVFTLISSTATPDASGYIYGYDVVKTLICDASGSIKVRTNNFYVSNAYKFLKNYPDRIASYLINDSQFMVSLDDVFYVFDLPATIDDVSSTVNLSDPQYGMRLYYYNAHHKGYTLNREQQQLIIYDDIDGFTVRVLDLPGYTLSPGEIAVPLSNSYVLYHNSHMSSDVDYFANSLILSDSTYKCLVVGEYARVTILYYKTNEEPMLNVEYLLESTDESYEKWSSLRNIFYKTKLTKRWNNEQWFASDNVLFRNRNNDFGYISLSSYAELGNPGEPITGMTIAQDNLFLVYKNDKIYTVQYGEVLDNTYDYLYTETKNNVGNDAVGNCIVSALTEMPLQVSYDGIYALNQLKNVATSDRICVPISENINLKWLKESKDAISKCITLNRLYWTYFVLTYRQSDYINYDKEYDFVGTKVYLLDNRTGQWYYWELPIITISAFSKDNKTYFADEDGILYTLQTSDILNKYNNEITEYYDEGYKLIPWKWVSQIMPLGTINYSKRLIDTTFILTDTDTTDEYGLMYKFKSFRKMASQTGENTISNKLNYIQSVTKKTLIPRCNFVQLELSNIEDDLNNNKLRLVGLGFRYVLLEGLY